MNKYISLTFLAAFVGVMSETPVYQCNNNIPLPLSAGINDCELLPCLLPQGSTVTLNATFSAVSDVNQLKPEVILHALGVSVMYPLTEPDGCKGLINSRCPIEEGETVTYQLQMPILALFPRISVTLEFIMYGDGEPIRCFMVDVDIVEPKWKIE